MPPPPPQLGNTILTELLRNGAVSVTIDPKYPQAIGISSVLALTARFGNFTWEILHNDFDDSPFFTSDFPVAIEKTDDPRIRPDLTLDRGRSDFSFANFGYRRRKVGRKELVKLNCWIVRCAEDCVFYRDDRPWVRPFVTKNRHYRIEPHTHKLKNLTGTLLVSTLRAVTRTPPVDPRSSNSG